SQKPGPGEGYFGVWQTRSGAIRESALFPNPVRDQRATLRYTLDKKRTVSIVLRDITGTILRKFSTSQARPAGEQTEELSLGDLIPGMYLVTIETDSNEYAVQRLILE